MPNPAFKRLIVLIFLLLALPTGLLLAVLTPAGQVPDERAHMSRALGLLHGAVLGERQPGIDAFTHLPLMRTGVKVDFGMFNAASAPVTLINGNPMITDGDLTAQRNTPADHTKIYVDLPNTATYFPIAYLPATMAVAIGQALQATPYTCFLLARFAMLAAFLLLGSLALWFAAFGEAALLTILLLPMTLFLAGSVSQDAIIVALTCLACALLTRNTSRSWLAGLLVLLVILLSKPPYLPLLALFLLPLRRATFWRKLGAVALACLPVLLWAGLVAAVVAVPYPMVLYHPGPLYHGDASIWLDHGAPAQNLHILLADPSRLVTIPWKTLQLGIIPLLQQMLGVLGLLRIGLPLPYYNLWALAGAAATAGLLLCARPDTAGPRTALGNFLVTLAAITATIWLMMIVFYVNFTNAGWDSITGLQGRYFLPLLPFLLFAIPGPRLRFKLAPLLPALPAIALGLYDIGYLPLTIVKSFYLH